MAGDDIDCGDDWTFVWGFDKIKDPRSDQHWLVFYDGRLNVIDDGDDWAFDLIRDGWLVGREAIGVSRLDMAVIDQLLYVT